jgi:hypothetical protein
MDYEQLLISWIAEDSYRMEALEVAETLGLKDWCLAAGFVRNFIWDKLSDKSKSTPLNDVDLIYHDVDDLSEQVDITLENRLKRFSSHPWSVKNQARMHHRNGDRPYASCAEAMRHWVEVETAVGVSFSRAAGIQIIAPFGLSANFANTITLNQVRPKPRAFSSRLLIKHWQRHWPALKIVTEMA